MEIAVVALVVAVVAVGRIFRELADVRLTNHGNEFEEEWEFPLISKEEL